MNTALITALAAACALAPLEITPVEGTGGATYHAMTKKYELVFPNPDKKPPDVFVDGFRIKDLKSGGSCKGSGGINTRVFADADGSHILAIAYSGSTSYVEVFKSADCSQPYDGAFYTGKITVDPTKVTVLPGCECADKDETDCTCDPGGVFDLTAECALRRNSSASRALVLKEIGVDFAVASDVFHPGKPDVKLLRPHKASK